MSYDYLPGTQVVTVDGGLAAKRVPRSKSTIILGVSGKGPAGEPYQVIDRSVAAQTFGFDGNLLRGMEEVAQGGCDNIYLFRLGTKPAVLSGIGAVDTVGDATAAPPTLDTVLSAGYSVTFGAIDANVANDYHLYYDAAGVLKVFYQGNLVFSNDPTDPVDTSDVTVTGTINATHKGQTLLAAGTDPETDSAFDQSITLGAAKVKEAGTKGAAGTFWNMALSGVDADLGLTMDNCALYEAQQLAFELIEIFPIQRVFCPGAKFDAPNVAYNDDPAAGALGWLKTFEDADGLTQFHWAHKAAASNGETEGFGVQIFTSHTDRLAADYHEVHFPYQVARFCRKQSQNQGGCFGYIGFNAPKSYKAVGLRNWIGYLPVWGVGNAVVTAGKGLCGVPLLVGTTSDKLNTLCADIETKAYRTPGMYQTLSQTDPTQDGEYDEGPIVDRNGYPVDIGAHLHAVGEWAFVMNAAGTYQGNLAGVICGFESNLDPKSAITNKALPAVAQIYRVTLAQLNSLTKAKVNMLRFKGDGVAPALLHDFTCSTDASDYIFILRQNIKFLLCSALFQEADKFIGESSTDGLQLASLRTALDSRITDLKKRGYIAGCDYVIYSTLADRRIGRAFIDMTFNPPDEAVQIRASIAVGR